MKLLIVTQKVDATDSNLGFFIGWIEKFAKYADITVIANEVHTDAGNYTPKNVSLFSLGKEKGASRSARIFRYQKLLWQTLPRVDGIFFHMCPEYVLAANFIPKLFRKKSILWYTHKEVSRRLRMAALLVNKIFTASKESCRLSSKKIEVVGHGIDIDFFRPMDPQATHPVALRLLTVGRISPVKDLKTLIGGFLKLKKLLPAISLRLAVLGKPITETDTQYAKELKRLVPDAKDVFWGDAYHNHVREFYIGVGNGIPVLIHASKTGSLDKAPLEALAAGLPVFTSSEAFSGEIPGVTKFEAGNPNDLAEKIAGAFERGEISYNEAGREWVRKQHDLKSLVKKIVDFYCA